MFQSDFSTVFETLNELKITSFPFLNIATSPSTANAWEPVQNIQILTENFEKKKCKNSQSNLILDKTLSWCKPVYLLVFVRNYGDTAEDRAYDWCLNSPPSCRYVPIFQIFPKVYGIPCVDFYNVYYSELVQ